MEHPSPVKLAASLIQEGARHGARKQFKDAIACFRRAVDLAPTLADAHYNLGVAHRGAHQATEARVAFEQAVALKPDWPEAQFNLGNCYQDLRRSKSAMRCFEAALEHRPDYPKALNNLASLVLEQGDTVRAESLLQRAVQLQPDYPQALYNLARVYRKQRRSGEALAYITRAVELRPTMAVYQEYLADILSSIGSVAEATTRLEAFAARQPHEASTAIKLAQLLSRQSCDEAAFAVLERALASDPRSVPLLKRRAANFQKLKRFVDAERDIQRIIELTPGQSIGWTMLGMLRLEQCEVADAISAFENSLAENPRALHVRCALATALSLARRFEESRQAVDQVMLLQPDFIPARMNRAMLDLSEGNFAEGWREFEWRLLSQQPKSRKLKVPVWAGESLAGKSILLRAEQGLGDAIQFVRFAETLRARGARVVVECQPAACGLIARASGVQQVISCGEALPAVDYQIPLLSIPGRLNTTLSTLPNAVPYLFAEPDHVERWQKRLRPLGERIIGIAWQGNRNYRGDHFRSVPLANFRPLAETPGVALVSLQKGDGVEQLSGALGFKVHHFSDELDADGPFRDTVAIMGACDLIVSSDTAIVHLAGAMARPVWVALGYSPDWRWLREGSTSPWYPTMRLFRQSQLRDWSSVFHEMAVALQETSAGRGEPMVPITPQRRAVRLPHIAVSPGELIDKFIILSMKRDRLSCELQLRHVRAELAALQGAYTAYESSGGPRLLQLIDELREVNERLWRIEEELRECERAQVFGEPFIELARSVYQVNEQRAQLKRLCSELLGSPFMEEKSYSIGRSHR